MTHFSESFADRCACGCGGQRSGRSKYASPQCRTRAYRSRAPSAVALSATAEGAVHRLEAMGYVRLGAQCVEWLRSQVTGAEELADTARRLLRAHARPTR